MYIVRNKATGEIIHRNPAPLNQKLAPTEVFHAFDLETMEIGKIDGQIPEHWDIDDEGMVYQLPLVEQVARGRVAIPEGQKLEGDRFVPLSETDRLAAGEITVEELLDREKTRLRSEVEQLFQSGRTAENNRRIDGLTREKMSVTIIYRRGSAAVDLKNALLDERVIYPDEIFDELERGVQAVQGAYHDALAAVRDALQDSAPDIAAARAVTVRARISDTAVTFPTLI